MSQWWGRAEADNCERWQRRKAEPKWVTSARMNGAMLKSDWRFDALNGTCGGVFPLALLRSSARGGAFNRRWRQSATPAMRIFTGRCWRAAADDSGSGVPEALVTNTHADCQRAKRVGWRSCLAKAAWGLILKID